MPQMVRAVVVDPSSEARLAIRDVALPPAAPDDVTVRVTAISLNRGEVNRALSASEAGARPGWDFSGVVEAQAADGSGPAVGTRVVGMLATGAWAERVCAPSNSVAPLPDGVSDAQAATLPVAGLTALHALRQGGLLLGRKVLVDGAGRWRDRRGRASRGAARRGVRRDRVWPCAAPRAEGDDRRVVRRPHHCRGRSA
jgi:NADPH:quinone reductase